MHISTGWKFIKRNYPEANIEEMKEKIAHVVKISLRSLRPISEARGAEMFDINMHPDLNNRIFQILGYDIMFDTEFNVHLFEANKAPSLNCYTVRHGENGEDLKTRSIPDEINMGTMIPEALKISILKQDSKVYKKCYDSTEGDDEAFVYEKVTKIFRKLCGVPMRSTLTSSNIFDNLQNFSSTELNLRDVDLESVFEKLTSLRGGSYRAIEMYDFYNFLNLLADELNLKFDDMLTKMCSNL